MINIIKLKTIEGKTLEKVAEILKVSTTTINENENRLLENLKQYFKIQNLSYF